MCSSLMDLYNLEHYRSFLLQLYWHPYGSAALYDVCVWLHYNRHTCAMLF